MGIQDDPYTSYCLDEACTFMIRMIEDGNEPVFKKHYKSFADIYKDYQ